VQAATIHAHAVMIYLSATCVMRERDSLRGSKDRRHSILCGCGSRKDVPAASSFSTGRKLSATRVPSGLNACSHLGCAVRESGGGGSRGQEVF
jgi:hypothetical protein